jgi:hypothetical protein
VVSIPWLILLLTGLGFLGFGIAYALAPVRLGALTDVAPATPTARADFTATYGGFQIGFGVFLLACTRAAGWVAPGLWAATAALAGFASVRGIASLLGPGQVRRSIWFGLALERGGVALNAWALSQVR